MARGGFQVGAGLDFLTCSCREVLDEVEQRERGCRAEEQHRCAGVQKDL